MLRSGCQIARGPVTTVPISSRAGDFVAHFSECGLVRLDFPARAPSASCQSALAITGREFREWIRLTEQAVTAILAGHQARSFPTLDVSAGTSFQQRVWAALRTIPVGETKSYSEIASTIGSPKAARAVGGACGANPIPLLIPCHRVVGSGGKLGGFSGGLDWKKRLLAAEGVLMLSSGDAEPQPTLFGSLPRSEPVACH